MIRLMFVKGINEVDTPYFETKQEQADFFENASVVSYDDETAYYPPYYHNRIRLPSSDIPFSDESKKVNYLSLEYDGKTYYYFIDSMDYVTDDLTEISISMDTIQTFFFDMTLTKPTIKRMAIKRWSDDKVSINRDYIRENLSEMPMRKISKETMQYSTTLQWLVVRCSEIPSANLRYINDELSKLTDHIFSGDISYRLGEKRTRYEQTGGATILIPYGDWFTTETPVHVRYSGVDVKLTGIENYLKLLSSYSEVLSISLLPYNPFKVISFVKEGTDGEPTIYVSPNVITKSGKQYSWYYFDAIATKDSSEWGGLVLEFPDAVIDENELLTLEFNSQMISLPITSNFSKGVAYSSKFVPCMMDESYYSIQVGCNGTTAIAPLFYDTKIWGYAYFGVSLKGDRVYAYKNGGDLLGDGYGSIINDMHNGIAIDSNTIDYDLYTDPWKNYQVNHKGSMVTDWISTGANVVRQGAWMSRFGGSSSTRGGSVGGSVGSSVPMGETMYTAEFVGYRTGFVQYGALSGSRALPNYDTDLARWGTDLRRY